MVLAAVQWTEISSGVEREGESVVHSRRRWREVERNDKGVVHLADEEVKGRSRVVRLYCLAASRHRFS